jgi:Domain of unknown function (DUF1918)
MHADVGDWLIVKSHTEDQHTLRAEILAVHPGGEPPYTVRWLDDGREAVVFPGPNDQLITEAQRHALRTTEAARIDRVQAQIIADHASADEG